MNVVNLITHNLFSFILIISVIVFIHEFGHYWVARLCKIRVEEFAIGFGKEIFGFNAKNGTRWKFCLLPFGGYVKMFGDKNPASIADNEKVRNFTPEEKKVSFYNQNVYKKIAVVAAGPIANFILAILLLTIIFRIQGLTKILPVVGDVLKDSAAYHSGIKAGDRILQIDQNKINEFSEVQSLISRSNGQTLKVLVARTNDQGENEKLEIVVTPEMKTSKDFFGNDIKLSMVGISGNKFEYQPLNLGQAFIKANIETYNISCSVLKAIGELALGKRSFKELSGPVKIAEYSGKTMSMGFIVVIWFMAMISINLGVANLLPIPVLDGGHLFYYLIEAVVGKPLPERIQQYGFQFGFVILISLMLFTTVNDIYGILVAGKF